MTGQLVADEALTSREVREVHAVWCDLLIEMARVRRELRMLGQDTQAAALGTDIGYPTRRARRHLRRVLREASEL